MGWRIWIAALGLLCAVARAGVPEIPRFRVLTVADGLPSTTIPALARDKAGYLWLATWDGLARYDGVAFKVWRHDPNDPASLPGNLVQAIHIDAQDRIWVATENAGLSMLGADRRGFRHFRKSQYRQMGSDDVFAITSHGDDIWFGTFGGGAHRLSADGQIQRLTAVEGDPASLPSDNVMSLLADGRGQVWIGTMNGLARYDGKRIWRETLPGDETKIIYSLTLDGETIWAGTSTGVYRWQRQGGWSTPPWSRMFERPNAATALAPDGRGEYWLGSQGGLWRTHGDRAPAPITHDQQNVGRVVQSVLVQPDGGLWVPVPTRGVAYLRSDWQRIASLTPERGLSGGMYRGLVSSSTLPTSVWLGNSLGRIERLDTVSGQVEPLALPVDDEQRRRLRFTAILEDHDGLLWLGHNTGLMRWDRKHSQMREWSNAQATDALPDGSPVHWVKQSGDGSVWLATQMGSLQRRDSRSGRVLESWERSEQDGESDEIEAMQIGPDAQPWIASGRGIERWDPERKRFVTAIAANVERVLSFVFAGTDEIWLHRLSGLEYWQQRAGQWRRVSQINVQQGLPALESTGLLIDPQRRLWLGTRRGLFRIQNAQGTTPVQIRNFGVRDGLMSQEFNERGLLMTAQGVLIGTSADGSVILLDTQLPDPPPLTPHLLLDNVQVNQHDKTVRLPVQGHFQLQPDDHDLQISLHLLSYEDPLAHRYRSWLEGFDQGWVEQGPSGDRTFSNLRPGHYRLRMQAFDAAANPSEEKQLIFEVLPPWYRSVWGMSLIGVAGVLLLLMLAASYRHRLRRRTALQLAEHKREVAEQASLAKTRFLATLGHEVRTPMTGVMGMSELLLATSLSDTQRHYTSAIQRGASHLLRLVNDALDLARIEAGRLELDIQTVDLRSLIGEATDIMVPMARKRGLSFANEYADGVPPHVLGDPLRIRQILLNLLGNAIKFTEHGSVSLRVLPAQPQGVCFEISDTGPGISAEQQARLFKRFEQGEGARTASRYGGSGLGLAICQELVAVMGGHIRVESRPGQGANFIVELPLKAVSPASPAPVPAKSSTAPIQALSILLVEDEPMVAEVVVGLLAARGHRVVHAPHGLAALSEVAAHHFDVAVLDLDLPGLDGLALARQLRLNGFSAPLLALTARADAQAEPQARAAGFDVFVRKPVTGDMLTEALRRTGAVASGLSS